MPPDRRIPMAEKTVTRLRISPPTGLDPRSASRRQSRLIVPRSRCSTPQGHPGTTTSRRIISSVFSVTMVMALVETRSLRERRISSSLPSRHEMPSAPFGRPQAWCSAP